MSRLSNIHGALTTTPHKTATIAPADRLSVIARIAGAANALRRGVHGLLEADMFDGKGFVLGVLAKGHRLQGVSAPVVGACCVGSAIAASLAKAGVARLAVLDANPASSQALADRLAAYPALRVKTGSKDPAGFERTVNATPVGMNAGDSLPVDVAPSTLMPSWSRWC